ncbi:hypothetical protein [Lacticaseibacillus absianus]|uniref:hypothetical protein n=1 Tax=Lacticaseibacillus absianus TaxID=2729623 RepID=UPI0015CB2249|nr:hypothetical protein [Lacticaseibacillus absianus]
MDATLTARLTRHYVLTDLRQVRLLRIGFDPLRRYQAPQPHKAKRAWYRHELTQRLQAQRLDRLRRGLPLVEPRDVAAVGVAVPWTPVAPEE